MSVNLSAALSSVDVHRPLRSGLSPLMCTQGRSQAGGIHTSRAREAVRVVFVQDVMTREPATVTGETSIKRAAQILEALKISSLPVLDEHGRLCGVVSEADLIREAFVPDARGHMLPGDYTEHATAKIVGEVMTPHAITAHESADIAEVADVMISSGVKCLPVVDDHGHLVGVVSRSDLVKVRARADDVIEKEIDQRLVSMGFGDWLVEVTDGAVEIDGPVTTTDRSIAEIIVSTVPGVAKVRVR